MSHGVLRFLGNEPPRSNGRPDPADAACYRALLRAASEAARASDAFAVSDYDAARAAIVHAAPVLDAIDGHDARDLLAAAGDLRRAGLDPRPPLLLATVMNARRAQTPRFVGGEPA